MKSSYYVNHPHKTCICFSLTPIKTGLSAFSSQLFLGSKTFTSNSSLFLHFHKLKKSNVCTFNWTFMENGTEFGLRYGQCKLFQVPQLSIL